MYCAYACKCGEMATHKYFDELVCLRCRQALKILNFHKLYGMKISSRGEVIFPHGHFSLKSPEEQPISS